MKFAIIVNSSPFSHQAAYSAYHFCQAALAMGHSIERVFFYNDGAHIGTNLAMHPQDETDPSQLWQQLSQQYQFPLDICVNAALRRGISDEEHFGRANLADEFKLVGLGQLMHACLAAERLVVFGG